MSKGQKFSEWIKSEMDERNITTARVFLLTGFILGIIVGIPTCIIILVTH